MINQIINVAIGIIVFLFILAMSVVPPFLVVYGLLKLLGII